MRDVKTEGHVKNIALSTVELVGILALISDFS